MAATIEIELKLRIETADIPLLFTHEALRQYAQQDPLKHHLETTYFDTANQDLRRNGFALRIRNIDEKLYQTIKTSGKRQGDFHERQEWEQEVSQLQPDLTRISDSELRTQINSLVTNNSLLPLFKTEFVRTSWQLLFEDDTQVELALDQGKITANNQSTPISEIELELKSGNLEKISEFVDQLKLTIPLEVEHQSKADRGYELCMI